MSNTTHPLQGIKAVIWDYDGVHYDYAAFPPWYKFDHIRLSVVQRHLPQLQVPEILKIADEGYLTHGDVVQGFYDWARSNGHDAEAVRREIFKDYHRDLFNHVAENHPGHITPHQPTIEAFRRAATNVQHGLVTHSSLEHWALPLLKQQEMLEFFKPAAMFGMDDVGYDSKVRTCTGLERAMTALNVKPHEVLFAEDSMANIAFAHANLTGLRTAFIHHGKALLKLPPHVTVQEHSPLTVMHALAQAHSL